MAIAGPKRTGSLELGRARPAAPFLRGLTPSATPPGEEGRRPGGPSLRSPGGAGASVSQGARRG
eukprot:10349382-Alexandrium_andersonii.AAC.1